MERKPLKETRGPARDLVVARVLGKKARADKEQAPLEVAAFNSSI